VSCRFEDVSSESWTALQVFALPTYICINYLPTHTCSARQSLQRSGANPTILSCDASAVKIYNATSSPVRFENKIIPFYSEKTHQPTTMLAL
jgi:hypothetical protein